MSDESSPAAASSDDGEDIELYHAYDPELTGELTVTPVSLAPVSSLDRRGLLRRIQSAQAVLNQVAALQYEAVAAFVRTGGDRVVVARELALALAITARAAESQAGLAEALVSRLPETFAAMRRGEIDAYKAAKIHEPTLVLDDAQARQVDAIMAGRIGRKDPISLRRSTQRAVARVDPDGYAKRCARRRAQRRVELIPQGEGMVKLCADLPVEVGTAAYARIDAEARRRRARDGSTTLDQHRAAVLADHLLTDQSGVRVGPKAEVFVYLDFYTWLNLTTKPAELAGHGVIPAWLANHIASGENTTLRRLITDPEDGQILSVGRRRYRPPAALARLAYVRDRECRFPVCHRPAQVCELDHVMEWDKHHGETSADNLAAFCSRDHHLKDAPGWSYTMDKATGEITITTPTGDDYPAPPNPCTNPAPTLCPTNNPLPAPAGYGERRCGHPATRATRRRREGRPLPRRRHGRHACRIRRADHREPKTGEPKTAPQTATPSPATRLWVPVVDQTAHRRANQTSTANPTGPGDPAARSAHRAGADELTARPQQPPGA